MIRLQFSTSQEVVSLLIRHISHSRFSHVDLVLPDGNLLGASDSPLAPVIEGNPSGVAIRPPNYQKFGIRRMAELDFGSTAIDDAIMGRARSQIGKAFDHTAMTDILNSSGDERDWRNLDMWFCSEMFTWTFEDAGALPWKLVVNANRVTPPDLVLIVNPFLNVEKFLKPIEGLVLDEGEMI